MLRQLVAHISLMAIVLLLWHNASDVAIPHRNLLQRMVLHTLTIELVALDRRHVHVRGVRMAAILSIAIHHLRL